MAETVQQKVHVTSLVKCGGKVAGFECSCGYQSDHGWTPLGAEKAALTHQVLADAGLLAGERDE